MSQGSRMSALAKGRLGPSACRADTATPLQNIYNIHIIYHISGIDMNHSVSAGPRLSSCPFHNNSIGIAKIHHCLPQHQTLTERMQSF